MLSGGIPLLPGVFMTGEAVHGAGDIRSISRKLLVTSLRCSALSAIPVNGEERIKASYHSVQLSFRGCIRIHTFCLILSSSAGGNVKERNPGARTQPAGLIYIHVHGTISKGHTTLTCLTWTSTPTSDKTPKLACCRIAGINLIRCFSKARAKNYEMFYEVLKIKSSSLIV
jgi:hypothetical protein